ncbi:SDR family NAD(P)-dependent oxidoreductase [Rhizobium sp. WYJ-E13]|uniref:SDR family NAD(P)-dependent oxidoreductase n=1 Tax=Rhizobium sp. WYJ-E13 TaxID=2849093 RepID=UPI001C1EEA85|nr:SDR family NAD(P)-dependent oxidoreductase [Rhizobium sp. WYJ-E13]QWW72463.1 SDR family NAD(P)-dependent oxidoreductase [Rhizobium sp. WYJ-E13]
MSKLKVWFITGASRGLGKTWAQAALDRGDSVVAAVRDLESVADLKAKHGERVLPVKLDVTNAAEAANAVQSALDHFGRIDVLINNAGYCLAGALEEVDEADARKLFDTNLLGALWTTRAVLPAMRARKAGHVIAVSSVSGLLGQPTIGLYNSSKWALEGMMESLALEVSHLGIKVSILEPVMYATDFSSAIRFSTPIEAYEEARSKLYGSLGSEVPGDPSSTVADVLALVDNREPPLRCLLGDSAWRWVVRAYGERLARWAR